MYSKETAQQIYGKLVDQILKSSASTTEKQALLADLDELWAQSRIAMEEHFVKGKDLANNRLFRALGKISENN